MNNIAELIEIIRECGGIATLDEICHAISQKYRMIIMPNHRSVVLNTLNNNLNAVKRTSEGKWIVRDDDHDFSLLNMPSKGRVQERKEAIASYIGVDADNCTYASYNANSRRFWANPSINVLKNDWWLLLDNHYLRKVYVFFIPKDNLSENQFIIRDDNTAKNKIEMKIRENESFIESRSGIEFKKWLIQTIQY